MTRKWTILEKSNILNNMMLLKGLAIYKEFQSNTTVTIEAPDPATKPESPGELWGRCQRGFLNVDYSHHLPTQISRSWAWKICVFKEPLSDSAANCWVPNLSRNTDFWEFLAIKRAKKAKATLNTM